MASLTFPVTGSQSAIHDQPAPAPATPGAPRPTDPNQQDVPQGDTVTISASFPPAQAVQQTATVTIEQFSLFINQTQAQTVQATAAPATAPTVASGAPAQPQANSQAAAASNTPASSISGDPPPAVAAPGAPSQTAAATNPQQELAQLDQTLQQLGIDPQSISLFNRMGLLLYANDPAALQNLVQALQQVDQQLNQLNGGTDTTTNSTSQPHNAAQALLANANQPQAQAQQATAQLIPEPLIPIKGFTPAQPPPTPLPQLEGQGQNTQTGNAGAGVFEAQLSFSDVQATFQEQSTQAQGAASNQSSANNIAAASSAQANNLLVNFQELQLTFQAIEIQSPQQQPAGANNPTTQNQGINVDA